jgi:ubiquinone/menaquinone biosynthesis C-methylase UbiE
MEYLHGYDEVEQNRLISQAQVLEDKIFEFIDFSGAKNILEVGCGVGAQTEILLNRYPNAKITGIEISDKQLDVANYYIGNKYDRHRFELLKMDAEHITLPENTFDSVYICWVLEHVKNPQKIIDGCFKVLKTGGKIVVSEVQNNNLYIVPKSDFVIEYWAKYNKLQEQMGGNPYVGVEVGNYLYNSGFKQIDIKSRTFLYDNNKPQKRNEMTDYWLELMLSGFPNLEANKMVIPEDKARLVADLQNIKKHDGVFHYAFIQSQGVK